MEIINGANSDIYGTEVGDSFDNAVKNENSNPTRDHHAASEEPEYGGGKDNKALPQWAYVLISLVAGMLSSEYKKFRIILRICITNVFAQAFSWD